MKASRRISPLFRSRSIAMVAIVLAVVLAASPAWGLRVGTLRYPHHTTGVPNAEPGVTTDTADCPADHPVATGGGAEITGNQTGLDLEIGTTLPESPGGKGWTVTANNSSPDAASMKTYAICAKNGVVDRVATKNVPRNSQGEAKAACPAGTKIVGGGAGITGDSHTQEVATTEPADGPDGNHEPDDAWLGRANNGLNQHVILTVVALCSGQGAYDVIITSPKTVPNRQQVAAEAHCPQGEQVTGGGIEIAGDNLGIEVADAFPIDGPDADHVPDDGWHATANNDATGHSTQMQVFAICKQ
jgi:hypothetical protein